MNSGDAEVVQAVVRDAEQARAGGPEVSVPLEERKLHLRIYAKPQFAGLFGETGVLEESIDVHVPKMPNGEAAVLGQVFSSFRQLGSVVVRREGKATFYPLDLFTHYEFEFSNIVSGIAKLPLVVGK